MNRRQNSVATRSLAKVTFCGKLWRSLQVDLFTSFPSFFFGRFVGFFTSQNLLLALGFAHVLDAHVNALLDDPSVHFLVDAHSDRTLGYVEDDSGATVVRLVRHALVNGGIGENVDVVTDFDVHQVLRQMDGSALAELLGKHVARTRPGSVRVRHLSLLLLST